MGDDGVNGPSWLRSTDQLQAYGGATAFSSFFCSNETCTVEGRVRKYFILILYCLLFREAKVLDAQLLISYDLAFNSSSVLKMSSSLIA
jgi:hypothetical protein